MVSMTSGLKDYQLKCCIKNGNSKNNITGSNDPVLYAPAQVSGSNSGNPDSRGFQFEVDHLPIDYVKLAIQYTVYDKFNGDRSNYDGFGRDASDNNTIYFLVWLVY